MITPALMCVAMAVYFEARGEPTAGQIAVAQVIRNRIEDPRYPDNACDVVKQGYYWNGIPIRNKCQFSFYCDGKSDDPKNKQAWFNSLVHCALEWVRTRYYRWRDPLP
jgi:spore germination cell wall hydrolase CwlJ-like protein